MLHSDNLIPLVGGAYQARSSIANYQICENLFVELNPPETEPVVPATHYQREGKRPLSAPPVMGPGRGVFTLSNGSLYAAVGNSIYYIDQNWNWNLLGQVNNLVTPISMTDNGATSVVVDGTPSGWTITLAGNIFANLVDPTGLFVGSIRTDFDDTFIGFVAPNTNEWYLTLSDQVNFNALVQANKDTHPDDIVTFAFNIRQAWLIGETGTEVWYLAGGTPFPYQEWPNVFIPYGCAAPYSLVQADINLFWIAKNPQGNAIAVMTKGLEVIVISTPALNYLWAKYKNVSDAIGMTFQQAGHIFVVFHFQEDDASWAYDLQTKQWHRRTFTDNNGIAHRESVSFCASVDNQGGYPKTIVGQDWKTGQLYALDPEYYLDGTAPIVCKRSFPHALQDMKEITHVSFVADFETGVFAGSAEDQANTPALSMRYSSDGGNTWSNYRQKKLISAGNYRSMMRYRGLGMARDRVYELSWSYNGKSALQGAYIEPIVHGS